MVVRLQTTVGVPRLERGIKVIDGRPYMYVEFQDPYSGEPYFFVPEGYRYYYNTETQEIRLRKIG